MSLALVLCTEDRILAASDSRGRICDTDTYVDTVRKIDIFENYLFAATGLGDPLLDAWRRTVTMPGESAEGRANRVLHSLDKGHEDGDALFGIFRFCPKADGHAMKLRLTPKRIHVVQEGRVFERPYGMAFGWDDGGAVKSAHIRRILPLLKQRPSEEDMEAIARDTMRLASEQSEKVGGPVHVAILDADGSRWKEAV